jgi:hypothetical protein
MQAVNVEPLVAEIRELAASQSSPSASSETSGLRQPALIFADMSAAVYTSRERASTDEKRTAHHQRARRPVRERLPTLVF